MKQTLWMLMVCCAVWFHRQNPSQKPSAVVLTKIDAIQNPELQKQVKNANRKEASDFYYRRQQLEVKKGDYKSAQNNDSEHKTVEGSLLNAITNGQLAESGARYKTPDKESEIFIERTQLAENDLIIQKRNFLLLGWIALVIVLSIIGCLFYNQQKLKKKQLQKESELKDAVLKIETQNRFQEQRLQISRDLHDNIGAQLAFIISSIDNLKYSFDITDQKLNEKLTSISDFTSETIYELRDTIWAMNKTEITLEDLQSRISNYIDKVHVFEGKVGFSFHVDMDVNLARELNAIQGINIHRVIQEAIHNSLKHANSKTIKVSIEKFQELLKFTISDDGQGFNIETVEKGNGLLNMQKRIHEIGGEIQIISRKDKGTQIEIIL